MKEMEEEKRKSKEEILEKVQLPWEILEPNLCFVSLFLYSW